MPHTQGPFSLRHSTDGSGDIGITATGLPNIIAECFASIRHSKEKAVDEALANATLFIAAPEMLAVLKELVEFFEATGVTTKFLDRARAAIRAATDDGDQS